MKSSSSLVLAITCLAALGCGKVAGSADESPRESQNDNTSSTAGSAADAGVACTLVDRGDECRFDYECRLGFVCADSGRRAVETCADGTSRTADDQGPVLACLEGDRLHDGCVHHDFYEACSEDAQCPEGQRCVDSGRSMPSYTIVCPEGGGGSSDSRVVHECRVVEDGGT